MSSRGLTTPTRSLVAGVLPRASRQRRALPRRVRTARRWRSDTEADYAAQAAWLDQDLAASPLPWKIVYMHRPPYSSGNHGSDLPLRRLLAPIFEKHHVQLVLAGHDHDYERMKPQGGVAYVVTGGGGRGTYNVGSSELTAFAEEVIHFVTIDVGIDELVLHAIDGTGVEFDSMVVPRVR